MEELGLGTQVAAPLFIPQNIAGHFLERGLIGKKRSLGCNTTSFQKQQFSEFERTTDGWNPKDWEWDSARFMARARPPLPNVNVGPLDNNVEEVVVPVVRASTASWSSSSRDEGEKSGDGPLLELGGANVSSDKAVNGGNDQRSNSVEETAASLRPNKKVRSGSPGSGATFPMCQVDNCTEDLSKARDYHRRHKVCVPHSKATNVVVGKQMQRFCQQCSRFHPLSEFDEGKRSCRRRLAGHNKRRRKSQPEDATSPIVPLTDSNKTSNGNLDIVNLLTVLASGQGIPEKNVSNRPPLPDKNQLIEILSKLKALPQPTDLPRSPAIPSGPTKNIINQAALGQNNSNVNPASKSNLDFPRSQFCNKPTNELLSLRRGETSTSSHQSPTEDSDGQVQDTGIILPLQLFSSSPENGSPPNRVSSHQYFSSDSCSPPEEMSHSPSVPITRSLFPLETTSEINKPDRMSICQEPDVNFNASEITLELFTLGNRALSDTLQSLPHQAGYTSSGSDHSPPSFNSDPQNGRTGRIMFKLFDKDPGHFPGTLRTQIYNWLSNSPLEMESFIRPGCVVLSVYVSMPSTVWKELEENFAQLVSNLVLGPNTEFWRSGRFSVNIGRHLAFHKGGNFNFCKPWTPNYPEMVVVSPLAVVSGQATSLVIRGRNLNSPGTKIHYTYMGGYSSEEILGSTNRGLSYDEITLDNFNVHAATSVLGRCFIEVENGVRGNSFPVIIADAKICQELRLLEREFEEQAKLDCVITNDQTQCITSPGLHEEILCFLNELGWLFQRQSSSDVAYHNFAPHRFQYLLTFSIERDFCALAKTLLDIFVENGSSTDGLSPECTDALAKMHLLHKAVNKKSKRMVDMLVHYSVSYGDATSKRYVFPPNLSGPGGITPLHLAACSSGSYDIVDILTNDPLELGLHNWKSLVDDNGQSPAAYAIMRNDHSLNSLISQKLVDRINKQVSLSIGIDMIESSEARQRSSLEVNKKPSSCSKCAMMTHSRMPGSHGMLHRPFIHSMLAIAAVCVCVCLFFKSMSVPLTWENLDFGSM